jgi:hypothetical protein
VVAKFFASSYLAPRTSGLQGCVRLGRVDVLFVGSSMTRQGYDVASLERELGGSVYSLAYNGLTPRLMDEILAHLSREMEGRIGKVVVEVAPLLAAEDREGLSDVRLVFDAPYQLKARLLGKILGPVRNLETASAAYELIVTASNDAILSYPVSGRFVESLSYRGGYAGKVVPSMSRAEFFSISERAAGPASPRPEISQAQAYRDIATTLKRAGIPYTFVEIPLPRGRQDGPRYKAAKLTLKELLGSTGEWLVEIPQDDFDIDDHVNFADPVHLSSMGRQRFSALVAKMIRAGRI